MILLGQTVDYSASHQLFPIARSEGRRALGLSPDQLPFGGYDLWNAYELSWLNPRGKPVVATGVFVVPATSPFLIESKSLKLFLNGLHQRRYNSASEVEEELIKAMSQASGSEVKVTLNTRPQANSDSLNAVCLDEIDCAIDVYQYSPHLLKTTSGEKEETLVSHLLKSNCPVTGQPDWGRVAIHYRGAAIDYASLLRYIVSFRQHSEFHEQCVERMFCDIEKYCAPAALTVWANYTRRGGLDINPVRSNEAGYQITMNQVWRQ